MNYTSEMIQAIGLWRDYHQVWIKDNIEEILQDAYWTARTPGNYICDFPEERELTPWCYFSLVISYYAEAF